MYFDNHFSKSFINLVGNLDSNTAHSTADLTPGQLAFVDAKTFSVLNVGAASFATHPLVILAQGSLYTDDKLGKYHGGYKESVKSRPINGRLITRFTKYSPKTEQAHVIQIGYNGSVNCACPSFNLDTTYTLHVEVKGSPVLRAYTRNVYRNISVYTGCPIDGQTLADPTYVMQQFAAGIQADPELSKWIQRAAVVVKGSNTISGVQINIYQASRTDTGDIIAIAAVAQAYPGAILVSRVGQVSTYEIHQLSTLAAPTNNVNSTGLTWAQTDVVYKGLKKICITMPLKADGSSNLGDIVAAYAADTRFLQGSFRLYNSGTSPDGTTTSTTSSTTSTSTSTTTQAGNTFQGCTETIEADIFSDNEIDLICEGTDNATFTTPQSFRGYTWGDCPCDTVATDTTKCVGLRLVAKTTAQLTDKFSNASFDPLDHVETEPIYLIASFRNNDGDACEFTGLPVTEIQQAVVAQGLGEYVVRQMIESASYSQDYFNSDPRIREVINYPYLNAIDRTKFYVRYQLAHMIPNRTGPSGSFGEDRYVYNIFIEQSLSTDFETWMNAYLTSAGTGVALEVLG